MYTLRPFDQSYYSATAEQSTVPQHISHMIPMLSPFSTIFSRGKNVQLQYRIHNCYFYNMYCIQYIDYPSPSFFFDGLMVPRFFDFLIFTRDYICGIGRVFGTSYIVLTTTRYTHVSTFYARIFVIHEYTKMVFSEHMHSGQRHSGVTNIFFIH